MQVNTSELRRWPFNVAVMSVVSSSSQMTTAGWPSSALELVSSCSQRAIWYERHVFPAPPGPMIWIVRR
jgi:hypothetical protein